jgi:hypothetical protein
MLLLIIIPLCIPVKNMPMPTVKFLKNNGQMSANTLQEKDISWEKTNNCKNIIEKYFNKMSNNKYKNNDNEFYGEIFKILGHPASLIIVNNKLNCVDEFIINKNLILMFDAAPLMRWSFYKNYYKLNIKNAINKDIFLII